MRPDEQTHIAGILAESAQRLREAVARSPAPEGTSGAHGAGESCAALEAIAERISDVDHALREDVERRRRRSPTTRLQQWATPRLGILRHHPPVPLRVPTSYLQTTPPPEPPLISIVTPSYEQGRYLERTLYSVLSQRYPRLEYVVQDGGSSDETGAVLERHGHSLSHWASEADAGQADAINRGFAHTGGEIMAYLNSDDLLLPGSLAYVARYFAAHPDVDVLYGHRLLIDEHDRQVGRWVLPRHDDRTLTLVDFVPQETLFWRREAWRRAGARIDVGLRFAIDWDLLLRLREAGARMVRVPRYLGAFRVHSEQKTAREMDVCLQECELLRARVLDRAISHEEAFARAQPYLRRHVLHHNLHALRARLPGARSDVRTIPLASAIEDSAVSAFDRR
jgi:glycosyltransferase involved in cell wall biosynthesis